MFYNAECWATGPFQGHVCDQKVENFTFQWLQLLVQIYAINKFLIDFCTSCWSQDKQVFENQILRHVNNKIHVTIGHVCDMNHACANSCTDRKKNQNFCFENTSQVPSNKRLT